jgi:hypothetical protein
MAYGEHFHYTGEDLPHQIQKAQVQMMSVLGADNAFSSFFLGMAHHRSPDEAERIAKTFDETMMPVNAIAKAFRENTRAARFAKIKDLIKKGQLPEDALAKAQLDVGTLTNFAQITGGESLGYVSLDTQLARGTVRPNSFTIYQCLNKSAAYQVVDYWPYAFDTGGGLPGTAFQSFGNVATGTLNTNAGDYSLQNITLKLAVDGRAITVALAAQNSFVDIGGQETINASLTVLSSVNWACYWGNPTIFPNQFAGIASQVPAANVFDWYQFSKAQSANGWSSAQAMFNLIYEAAGTITSFRQFGRITHAFMSPVAAGALQGLVTTLLNNIVTVMTPSQERLTGIVVDGDLQGMRTRFGEIQFPIDLFINARDKPAQAIVLENGQNMTSASVTPITSVTAAASGTGSNGSFDTAYTAGSGIYSYAVAAVDAAMNESTLVYALGASGVVVSGSYALTITPNGSGAAAFRVYRSGLGYNPASSGVANAASFRYIGTIAASGSSAVTFYDKNTYIPGSENIFLLDLDEQDMAIDFRYLLPLSRIDLFAQNLFMPWAVAMIGSIRLRIPKFHGLIQNFIPDNPVFNPLSPNPNAT